MFSIRKMITCAIVVALGIVMKIYLDQNSMALFALTSSKIPFSWLAIYLCAFIGGPWLGGISGVLVDLLGTLITGQAPIPGLTVSAFLLGVMTGYLYLIPVPKKFRYLLILSSVLLGQLLFSSLLNTYWLSLAGFFPSKTYVAVVTTRTIYQAIYIPGLTICSILVMGLYDKISRIASK